jgi:hypothetical protein
MAEVVMVALFTSPRTGRLARRLPAAVMGGPRSDPDHMSEESMETRDGHQKGPQQHAEGQHGEKAHSRFLEQIHQPTHRDEDEPSEHDGASESGGDDRQRR